MKRVAWATDIHLNFVDASGRRAWAESLVEQSVDGVFLSGDIGESPNVARYLAEMAQIIQRPIYFVLGNHDFYRGSIARTRHEVARLAADSPLLTYLTDCGVEELTGSTAVVGHDGWGDARLGQYYKSDLLLNDFFIIEELKTWQRGPQDLDRRALRERLVALGDEAAGHFARVLPEALESHRRVVVVTHVPPFREAAWHEGKPSDDNWLPFFASKAVGDVMLEVMEGRPDRELLVLCGHTHGSGQIRPRDNIHVLTGGAEYHRPSVQQILEFE